MEIFCLGFGGKGGGDNSPASLVTIEEFKLTGVVVIIGGVVTGDLAG